MKTWSNPEGVFPKNHILKNIKTSIRLSQTYFNSLASYIFNLSTFHNIASSFSSFGYDRNTSNVLNIVANPHSNPNMEPIDLPVVNMSNTHVEGAMFE